MTNAEKRRRYRARHPERVRDQQAQWRASTKGIVARVRNELTAAHKALENA